MERNLVHEKGAFNCPENNLPFYIDCLDRKIKKKAPASIYHYHDKIELLYCLEGELEITLFSKSIVLKPGDFIYLAQNTPHATTAYSDTNRHICIKFANQIIHVPSSRNIPSEEYFVSLLSDYEVFTSNDENREQIYNLFVSSYENFSHDDYFKRLTLCSNIMAIMAYIFKETTENSEKSVKKNTLNNFSTLFEYIDENFATITLEDAARYCAMSYSYFSRNFKSEFGISFTNFVTKKRVEKSLDYLSKSDMSLNDVALECGFSNLSHYIKCFNQEKGLTPKKFRSITAKR